MFPLSHCFALGEWFLLCHVNGSFRLEYFVRKIWNMSRKHFYFFRTQSLCPTNLLNSFNEISIRLVLFLEQSEQIIDFTSRRQS